MTFRRWPIRLPGRRSAAELAVYLERPGVLEIMTRDGVAPQPMVDAEAMQRVLSRTPLQRIGAPEEIGQIVSFLASEKASYVTGEILGVNGGLERLNMQMPRAWGGMG